jgi:hypothetical protein
MDQVRHKLVLRQAAGLVNQSSRTTDIGVVRDSIRPGRHGASSTLLLTTAAQYGCVEFELPPLRWAGLQGGVLEKMNESLPNIAWLPGNEAIRRVHQPSQMAIPTANMGPIKGEISIAPMITAGLLMTKSGNSTGKSNLQPVVQVRRFSISKHFEVDRWFVFVFDAKQLGK